MVKIVSVDDKAELKEFFDITGIIYKRYLHFHPTGKEIIEQLTARRSFFHEHSVIKPMLILNQERIAGRFAFIHDKKMYGCLQIAFFEALAGVPRLLDSIIEKARELFPECRYLIVGLNGHLHYGAGILLNRFDEPPVYNLPYNPPYYAGYFKGLKQREIVTYRFPMKPFNDYFENYEEGSWDGITVRFMDKSRLKQEVALYTDLNNRSFAHYPYWSERTFEEEYEIFTSLGPFLRNENLIIAEHNEQPVGCLLWFPDYNKLLNKKEELDYSAYLRYRLFNPIKTYRFSQITVLPSFQISKASLAMIYKMAATVKKQGYEMGESGFIFSENSSGMALARKYFRRALKQSIEPYRSYAIFDGKL